MLRPRSALPTGRGKQLLTMNKKELSVLFLGKNEDGHCNKALQFCQANFRDVTAHHGKWGDPFPEELTRWKGDYVISYLSRWIVPEYLLRRAKVAAINFHPASPDYPGIGCNNFALYDEVRNYGVTCHHMLSTVDTGAIVAVRRFSVFPSDNVASLLERTYDHQLVLFYEIVSMIIEGRTLPVSEEKWTRRPSTRKQFEELRRITPDMSKEEIVKRTRATNFGVWKPTVELQGFVFELKGESQ